MNLLVMECKVHGLCLVGCWARRKEFHGQDVLTVCAEPPELNQSAKPWLNKISHSVRGNTGATVRFEHSNR